MKEFASYLSPLKLLRLIFNSTAFLISEKRHLLHNLSRAVRSNAQQVAGCG